MHQQQQYPATTSDSLWPKISGATALTSLLLSSVLWIRNCSHQDQPAQPAREPEAPSGSLDPFLQEGDADLANLATVPGFRNGVSPVQSLTYAPTLVGVVDGIYFHTLVVGDDHLLVVTSLDGAHTAGVSYVPVDTGDTTQPFEAVELEDQIDHVKLLLVTVDGCRLLVTIGENNITVAPFTALPKG